MVAWSCHFYGGSQFGVNTATFEGSGKTETMWQAFNMGRQRDI